MKIDVFTSCDNGRKYLSVPKGTKLEALVLPEDFDPQLKTLSPFRTRMELDPRREHSALDAADIARQIEESGFAVHGAKGEITVGSSES
ncbi:MAG: hypothetical protein ACI9Y1_002760 [Lentisphaeria bacterium]|jgi:hypothetical protein